MDSQNTLMIIDETTLYTILGVAESADTETISNKYRQIAKQLHPDKFSNIDSEKQQELRAMFSKITAAFNTLKDNKTRTKYDLEMKIKKSQNETSRLQKEITKYQSHGIKSTLPGISVPNLQTSNIPPEKPMEDKEKKNIERGYFILEQAKNYISQQKFDEAINLLKQITQRYPKEAAFHSYLGLVMLKKGWNGYAQAEFKIALHYNPDDEIALKNIQQAKQTTPLKIEDKKPGFWETLFRRK